MQRFLTLIASIVGTVFHVLILCTAGITCSLISTSNPVFIVYIVIVFVSLIAIIYDLMVIFIWNKSCNAFAKRKAFISLIITYDFILAILYIVSFIINKFINLTLFFYTCALITCSVLYIVDLCKEKSRINSGDEDVEKTIDSNLNVDSIKDPLISVLKDISDLRNKKRAKQNLGNLALQGQIKKLNEMLETGIITEEEYKLLKKKHVMESIENK